MYTQILVPLDGSETAERGLREAIKLAAGQQTRLRLYCVIDQYPLLAEMAASDSFEESMDGLKSYGAELLEKARRTAAAADVDADTKLEVAICGSVAELISQEALASGCDLIAIGTHGRRGVSRLALGSTAEAVARACPVPVLLVHADNTLAPGVRHDLERRSGSEALTRALP